MNKFRHAARSVLLLVLSPLLHAAQPDAGALRVYGNTVTIELAPVLLATNAETQALRASVDNPDLRVILPVSEGLYRIVWHHHRYPGALAPTCST